MPQLIGVPNGGSYELSYVFYLFLTLVLITTVPVLLITQLIITQKCGVQVDLIRSRIEDPFRKPRYSAADLLVWVIYVVT